MSRRGSAQKSRATQSRQKWSQTVYDCRQLDSHTYKRGACVVCGKEQS